MIYELTNGMANLVTANDDIYFRPELVKTNMNKGEKALLIMKADYCGYCKTLLKTLQGVAFKKAVIFIMDQSDVLNKRVMNAFNVKGYPTIYIVDADGKIIVQEYEGERDVASLKRLFM